MTSSGLRPILKEVMRVCFKGKTKILRFAQDDSEGVFAEFLRGYNIFIF
jgi:hypothetical protein